MRCLNRGLNPPLESGIFMYPIIIYEIGHKTGHFMLQYIVQKGVHNSHGLSQVAQNLRHFSEYKTSVRSVN